MNKLMAQVELGMRSEMGNLEEFSKDLSFKIVEFWNFQKLTLQNQNNKREIARISFQIPSNSLLGNWKDLRRERIAEEKWEDCYKSLVDLAV